MIGHATQILFVSVVALVFVALSGRRRLRKGKSSEGGMARLLKRLQSPEWRRYGLVLMAGKLAGIALLLGATYFLNPNLFGPKGQ
jgi:hypothetical protein